MGFWKESFKNSFSVLQRHPLLSSESNFVVGGINHKHPARVETWSMSVYFWSNQRRVCAWITFPYIYFECSVSQKNGDVVLSSSLHGQVQRENFGVFLYQLYFSALVMKEHRLMLERLRFCQKNGSLWYLPSTHIQDPSLSPLLFPSRDFRIMLFWNNYLDIIWDRVPNCLQQLPPSQPISF